MALTQRGGYRLFVIDHTISGTDFEPAKDVRQDRRARLISGLGSDGRGRANVAVRTSRCSSYDPEMDERSSRRRSCMSDQNVHYLARHLADTWRNILMTGHHIDLTSPGAGHQPATDSDNQSSGLEMDHEGIYAAHRSNTEPRRLLASH